MYSGTRIKAGFHCHTTRSDGGLSPGETVEHYRARGFHCLGITDHRQVTQLDHSPGEDILVATVALTIVLSVVAHGLSANPLAKMYSARLSGADP